jgi:hypothetical protein
VLDELISFFSKLSPLGIGSNPLLSGTQSFSSIHDLFQNAKGSLGSG